MGDIYRDPRRYDLVLEAMDDVPLWRDMAERYGQYGVIEWFCGSGRIARDLAHRGHRVTAVDIHRDMLDYGRSLDRNGVVNWSLGDVRNPPDGISGSLGIVAANSLGHLHRNEDIITALRKMAGAMGKDGVLVISQFRPDLCALADADGTFSPLTSYEDGDEVVEVYHASTYDPNNQLERSVWRHVQASDASEVDRGSFTLRVIFPKEFHALIEAAGLSLLWEWGDHQQGAVSTESPLMVVGLRSGKSQ